MSKKKSHQHLFNEEWVKQASADRNPASWATRALDDSTGGQVYLATLEQWFDAYPLKTDDKSQMAGRLRNLKENEAHLGAVNELVWWQLMKRMDWKAEPVPCKKGVYTPDFLVRHPHRLHVEVTTENVSAKDRADVRPLDHKETARRLLNIVCGKKGQLCAAAAEGQPIALAVFDYTAWSGFGAEVARGIAEYVVCPDRLNATIPAEASAIVFVLSQFDGERFRVSVDQSAVYHNPVATHPLPESVFSWFPNTGLQPSVSPRPPPHGYAYSGYEGGNVVELGLGSSVECWPAGKPVRSTHRKSSQP